MRRADRLFQIVQFLRKRRRAVTAKVIAEHFEICERTVYRDIHALMASGVPISGAAGVGYLFDKKYELPPVMFNEGEIEALALGASMVNNWTDERFAEKARSALNKIEAVLPESLHNQLQQLVLFSVPSSSRKHWQVDFSGLHDSIRKQQKVRICYQDESGSSSVRKVRPLSMVFFGPVWLLTAWCELRKAFRNFRLDRIQELELLPANFKSEKGKTLDDYRQALEQQFQEYCEKMTKSKSD